MQTIPRGHAWAPSAQHTDGVDPHPYVLFDAGDLHFTAGFAQTPRQIGPLSRDHSHSSIASDVAGSEAQSAPPLEEVDEEEDEVDAPDDPDGRLSPEPSSHLHFGIDPRGHELRVSSKHCSEASIRSEAE